MITTNTLYRTTNLASSGLLTILLIFFIGIGCETNISKVHQQQRPAEVPQQAYWVGGPDGGVYVNIEPTTKKQQEAKKSPKAYAVAIYFDNGEPWYMGTMRLEPTDTEPLKLSASLFNGWDGEELHLKDGRRLVKAE